MKRNTVVVGVGRASLSDGALDWALAEAAMRRCDLVLVHVVSNPYVPPPGGGPVGVDGPWAGAQALVDDATARARRRAAGVAVRARLERGSPAIRLSEAAEGADLLVVGRHTRDPLPGPLVHGLAGRADPPVVVVPAGSPPPVDGTSGRIVVGLDDSAAATAAAEFAFREASLRGAPLTVVHVTAPPVFRLPGAPAPTRLDMADVDTATYLSELVAGFEKEYAVAADREFPQGDAAPALADASRGAALLVVGNRGHHGLTRAVLGSVSLGVLRTATCPVAVVRADKRT
jgi:nucleotide-binding universal stress UspA family protein